MPARRGLLRILNGGEGSKIRQRKFKGNAAAKRPQPILQEPLELGSPLRVAEIETRRLGLCTTHQPVVMEDLSREEA